MKQQTNKQVKFVFMGIPVAAEKICEQAVISSNDITNSACRFKKIHNTVSLHNFFATNLSQTFLK